MKKIIVFILALTIGCASAACNKRQVNNSVEDEKNLYIQVLERGYGISWLEKIAEAFEEKYSVNVEIKPASLTDAMTTSFESGPKYNDCDLYVDIASSIYDKLSNYKNFFDGYENGLMDYTEIFESNVDGGTESLQTRLNGSVADMYAADENGTTKYYGVPWAMGIQGLVVNQTVMEACFGSGYASKKLNTTDQFYAVGSQAKQNGYTALLYPGQIDTWNHMVLTWWAQYQGKTEFDRFFEGKVYDPVSETEIYSKDIFRQTGRLKALEVLEKLLYLPNGLHKNDVNDYGANNYTTLQKKFIASKMVGASADKYLFMPNGDWLFNEIGEAPNVDTVVMLKVPVVSSLAECLDSVTGTKEEQDEKLSAIIDYVDGTITKAQLDAVGAFSDEDITRVREARSFVPSQAGMHFMYSPVYCNAKKLVKKFLLYFASDEAIEIYNREISGGISPFSDAVSSDDAFSKSVFGITENAEYIDKYGTSALFTKGGLSAFRTNSGYYEGIMGCNPTSAHYKDAQTVYESEFYTDDAWRIIMQKAGLL